jgi:hypothetical protein
MLFKMLACSAQIHYGINHPESNLRTKLVSCSTLVTFRVAWNGWIKAGGAKDSFPTQKSKRSKLTWLLVRHFSSPNYPFCQDISNPLSGNGKSRLNQANDKTSITATH